MTARRELTSARHFGSKPGDLNIPIYLAPSLDIPPEEYQTASTLGSGRPSRRCLNHEAGIKPGTVQRDPSVLESYARKQVSMFARDDLFSDTPIGSTPMPCNSRCYVTSNCLLRSCLRDVISSFPKMWLRCHSTVRGLM